MRTAVAPFHDSQPSVSKTRRLSRAIRRTGHQPASISSGSRCCRLRSCNLPIKPVISLSIIFPTFVRLHLTHGSYHLPDPDPVQFRRNARFRAPSERRNLVAESFWSSSSSSRPYQQTAKPVYLAAPSHIYLLPHETSFHAVPCRIAASRIVATAATTTDWLSNALGYLVRCSYG